MLLLHNCSLFICCYFVRSYNLTIVRSIDDGDVSVNSDVHRAGHAASSAIVTPEKLEEGGDQGVIMGASDLQVSSRTTQWYY